MDSKFRYNPEVNLGNVLQIITMVCGGAAVALTGLIWLSNLGAKVDVNTKRLDSQEAQLLEQRREHNDFRLQVGSSVSNIEKSLSKLEGKIEGR